MKILLLGSGGREHAFAWKLKQSKLCKELFILPGNAGTSSLGNNVSIELSDFEAIKQFAIKKDIDVIIVGPEVPLVEGIKDYFEGSEIYVLGPDKHGAKLEGSKSFAKSFMQEFGIPTAKYKLVSQENILEGMALIDSLTPPIVLKADGLAAGKGVLILQNKAEAKKELKEMIEGKFGEASREVVIEEFLEGTEFSVFVLTDGQNYILLPEAKDYKRIGEMDTGKNTGGMGAVSPVTFVNDGMMEKVLQRIIEPTIRGIGERKMKYEGFIFFGLIVVDHDPYVIEYNCRMGDPETEVVFPRIKTDFVELIAALKENQLDKIKLSVHSQFATTVMLVSGGYPDSYENGKSITGMDQVKSSTVFHAGTKYDGGRLITNGGRVLSITSMGETMKKALEKSYKNAEIIGFDQKYYRKDIGFDL